ncbi:MAG: hypothetical protein QW687_05965 [Candidatus Hadarchaeales archaeon]
MKDLKRKMVKAGCFIILLIGCGMCGIYAVLLKLYSPKPADKCPSLEELLLPITVFPEEWEMETPLGLQWTDGLGRCNGVIGRQFRSRGGYASQRIIQLGSEWEAALQLKAELRELREPRPGASWVEPKWYESRIANEFQIRCMSDPGLGITECYILARYREKVCIFEAAMAPAFDGGLTKEELMKVLKEMDRLFGKGK